MTASFLTEEDKEKGPTGGFKVVFPDDNGLEEAKKRELEKLAHRELYRLLMLKEAAEDATLAQMRKEIEDPPRKPLNIRLEVVLVDEDRQAASFASGLYKIKKFLPESKDRFVRDAIATLKTVGAVPTEKGTQENSDKYRLCCALLKAENDWGEENRAAFEALKDNAELKKLIDSAKKLVARGNDSSKPMLYYGGLDERGHDRDEGRA